MSIQRLFHLKSQIVLLPTKIYEKIICKICRLVLTQIILIFLQKSCINFCIQAKPMEVYVPEETSGCLYHIWRLVTSPPFENFILFLIVLNTLLLMMKVSIQLYCMERNVVFFYSREILQQFQSSFTFDAIILIGRDVGFSEMKLFQCLTRKIHISYSVHDIFYNSEYHIEFLKIKNRKTCLSLH